MPNPPSSNKNARPNILQRTSTLFTTARANRKDHKSSAADISPPIVASNSQPLDSSPQSDSPGRSESPTPAPSLDRSVSKGSRHRRHSQSVDFNSLRRSVSLRSISSPHRHQRIASTATLALSIEQTPSSSHSSKPLLHIPNFTKRQNSADNVGDFEAASPAGMSGGMQSIQYKNTHPGRPPTSHSQGNLNYSQTNGGLGSAAAVPNVASGPLNPQTVYQHISDTCSKRISTLDYLRKTHEGRVYWFNTLLFTKPDLLKFSYFQPAKLARRATNYLLLGFSLPTILDLNSQTPTEYLRALNALLVEFEQYQSLHPPDGSAAGSLSRARIPHMFKRTTGKARRTSSATDALTLGQQASAGATDNTFGINNSSTAASTTSSFSSNSSMISGMIPDTLLPTESYQHLLTPSLPFDPDFFETFATLCDVLIDCYTKVTQLISSPDACVGGVGELFAKADARVRKVIVASVVREFEERCREGVKTEVAGVGKVVLGGLM